VIFEAEMITGIDWYAAESGTGLLGRYRKLAVMIRQIVPQDLVGFLYRASAGQAKLTHQPVLESTPQAFHASSSLGRARAYRSNTQFIQKPTELGMMLFAFQLFFD